MEDLAHQVGAFNSHNSCYCIFAAGVSVQFVKYVEMQGRWIEVTHTLRGVLISCCVL